MRGGMKQDQTTTDALDAYEPIDAFEIELRLRNNALKQRREALGLNQGELAERVGLSKATLTQYETLRKAPKGKDGQWRPTAVCLAEFFQVPPEALWPDVTQFITQPVIRRKAGHQEVEKLYALESERIREQHRLADPEQRAVLTEQAERVAVALVQLNPRERAVVELRFGLDGSTPMTLAEAGDVLGVSRNRAMQLQQHALRKLRHPSLSRRLAEVAWGPDQSSGRETCRADAVRFFCSQLDTRSVTAIGPVKAQSLGDVYSWSPPPFDFQLCVSCEGGNDAQMTVRVFANRRIAVLQPFALVPTPVDEEASRKRSERTQRQWAAFCREVRDVVLGCESGYTFEQIRQQFPGTPPDVVQNALEDLAATRWLVETAGTWQRHWQVGGVSKGF